MAGIDLILPGELGQLFKGAENVLIAAPGEVRAAAAAVKEGVAGENDIAHHQAHRAPGVARGLQDGDGQAAQSQAVALLVIPLVFSGSRGNSRLKLPAGLSVTSLSWM